MCSGASVTAAQLRLPHNSVAHRATLQKARRRNKNVAFGLRPNFSSRRLDAATKPLREIGAAFCFPQNTIGNKFVAHYIYCAATSLRVGRRANPPCMEHGRVAAGLCHSRAPEKSGGGQAAVQALRAIRKRLTFAERLDCGDFSTAFGRDSI